jgi:NAD(P)-dependent dehydrogenase (short-subunit alcohol dehydrogenase family)
MTAGSDFPRTIMIVDAGHGVGPALASLLADRGFDVIAWTRDGDAPPSPQTTGSIRWINASAIEAMDAGLLNSIQAVIFNMSDLDEVGLMASGCLADAVASDGAFFLQSLQAISRVMIENGRGQIWALAPDDSFAYYLPLPIAPVTHHTRIGGIRALAKELARFGVCANAAILQPFRETVEAAAWQDARAGVGSYAQKFKPVPLADVADTLGFWLARDTLPMNGSVVHFGSGVYDGNH